MRDSAALSGPAPLGGAGASPDAAGATGSAGAAGSAGVWPAAAAALALASSARLRRCSGISVIVALPDYSGPEMPPSLRTLQKWTAMKMTVMNGNIRTWSVYHRSSVSGPISTPPKSTNRIWSPNTGE